jgi:hypothetical protein
MFRIYYNTYWHELHASIAKAQTILLYSIHFLCLQQWLCMLCHIIQNSSLFRSNAFASSSLSIPLNNDTALTPRSCSFFTWSRIEFINGETTFNTKCLHVYNLFKYLNPNITSNSFAFGNGVINKWFPAPVVRLTKTSFFSFIIEWKAWCVVLKLSYLKILQTCWYK